MCSAVFSVLVDVSILTLHSGRAHFLPFLGWFYGFYSLKEPCFGIFECNIPEHLFLPLSRLVARMPHMQPKCAVNSVGVFGKFGVSTDSLTFSPPLLTS